jgi:hypothetical protein
MSSAEIPPSENQPSPPALPPVVSASVPPSFEISVDGNFPAALGAGLVAALIGAVAWAAVTLITDYQIGFMAVGIGFLVGYAIRRFGHGHGDRFAMAGAGLALLGCVLGNLLTVVAVVADQPGEGFFSVLGGLTPSKTISYLQASFQPMDLLFYAIAVYEGFKLSRAKT